MRKGMTYGGMLLLLGALACALAGSAIARSLEAPGVTTFSPKKGTWGSKVTFVGANFQGAQVTFGNYPASSVTVSPDGTTLSARVGRETQAGPNTITITTSDGVWTSTEKFYVENTGKSGAKLTPQITSFAPLRARVGDKVTIRGKNFGGAVWVKFGGVTVKTFRVPTSTMIVATVPKAAHSGKVSVKTRLGLASSPRAFTFGGAAT